MKILYFALAELAVFAVGYGLTTQFPHWSPHVWYVVAVASIALIVLIWISNRWPVRRFWYYAVSAYVACLSIVGGVLYYIGETEIRSSCLVAQQQHISFAIEENDAQHFERELRRLYPRLEECGLRAPLIDPVNIGQREYDSTWYGYHLTFLKVLRRWIRSDDVDINQWNTDVDRENEKRKKVADNHLSLNN